MNKNYRIAAGDVIRFKKHGEIIVGKTTANIGKTIQELENKYNDKILLVKSPMSYTVIFRKAEILDEAEKRYLRAVIRPFKKEVRYIEKSDGYLGTYIHIILKTDNIALPYFNDKEMYKGMELYKEYTVKELELYE